MSRPVAPGSAPLVLAPEPAARCTRTTRGAPGDSVSLVLGAIDREGLALPDGLGVGAGADRARTAIVLRRERETCRSSPLTVTSISATTAVTTSRSPPLSGIVFDAATMASVPIAPATMSLRRQRRGRLGCFMSCFLAVYAAGRSAPVPISRNPLASLERCCGTDSQSQLQKTGRAAPRRWIDRRIAGGSGLTSRLTDRGPSTPDHRWGRESIDRRGSRSSGRSDRKCPGVCASRLRAPDSPERRWTNRIEVRDGATAGQKARAPQGRE